MHTVSSRNASNAVSINLHCSTDHYEGFACLHLSIAGESFNCAMHNVECEFSNFRGVCCAKCNTELEHLSIQPDWSGFS